MKPGSKHKPEVKARTRESMLRYWGSPEAAIRKAGRAEMVNDLLNTLRQLIDDAKKDVK